MTPQFLLQSGDLTADGGLADIEPLRRGGKVQAFCNHQKTLQLIDVHADPSSIQNILFCRFCEQTYYSKVLFSQAGPEEGEKGRISAGAGDSARKEKEGSIAKKNQIRPARPRADWFSRSRLATFLQSPSR